MCRVYTCLAMGQVFRSQSVFFHQLVLVSPFSLYFLSVFLLLLFVLHVLLLVYSVLVILLFLFFSFLLFCFVLFCFLFFSFLFLSFSLCSFWSLFLLSFFFPVQFIWFVCVLFFAPSTLSVSSFVTAKLVYL